MTNKQTFEERLTNLEVRITFQDSTIEELNGVISELQMQVDRLKHNVLAVSDKVSNAFVSDDKDTKPPHY